MAKQKGPTVLVGHSYAGVVISGAANGAPNVEALVYIAAFGLDEGESIDALGKQGPPPAGAAAVLPPDDHGFLWIDRAGFAKAFAADIVRGVLAHLAFRKSGHRTWDAVSDPMGDAEAAATFRIKHQQNEALGVGRCARPL